MSTDCIMFPRLHVILQKPFLVSKQSVERSNHILNIMCKPIKFMKNHEKVKFIKSQSIL
eukprot:UN07150